MKAEEARRLEESSGQRAKNEPQHTTYHRCLEEAGVRGPSQILAVFEMDRQAVLYWFAGYLSSFLDHPYVGENMTLKMTSQDFSHSKRIYVFQYSGKETSCKGRFKNKRKIVH